jgi:hypothetical protein
LRDTNEEHPDVDFSYEGVGSGEGIKRFIAEEMGYIPLPEAIVSKRPSKPLQTSASQAGAPTKDCRGPSCIL